MDPYYLYIQFFNINLINHLSNDNLLFVILIINSINIFSNRSLFLLNILSIIPFCFMYILRMHLIEKIISIVQYIVISTTFCPIQCAFLPSYLILNQVTTTLYLIFFFRSTQNFVS